MCAGVTGCLVPVTETGVSSTRRRKRPWPAAALSLLGPTPQDDEVLLPTQDKLIALFGVALLKKYLLLKKA